MTDTKGQPCACGHDKSFHFGFRGEIPCDYDGKCNADCIKYTPVSEHGYCDKCGKPLDEHPTLNVEGINTLALCQERAIKWEKVEPGHVIPAGQPYRTEAAGEFDNSDHMTACEFANGPDISFTVDGIYDGERFTMLVDSSWKPPLVLPTEPTWGIAVRPYDKVFGQWHVDGEWFKGVHQGTHYGNPIEQIADFIPLTDEQIARIEAAR